MRTFMRTMSTRMETIIKNAKVTSSERTPEWAKRAVESVSKAAEAAKSEAAKAKTAK